MSVPETVAGEESPATTPEEDFEGRVTRLLEMIAEDPAVRDRVLVELYVTVAEFSDSFRAMQTQMESMGPTGFMRMIFGRGGKE